MGYDHIAEPTLPVTGPAMAGTRPGTMPAPLAADNAASPTLDGLERIATIISRPAVDDPRTTAQRAALAAAIVDALA